VIKPNDKGADIPTLLETKLPPTIEVKEREQVAECERELGAKLSETDPSLLEETVKRYNAMMAEVVGAYSDYNRNYREPKTMPVIINSDAAVTANDAAKMYTCLSLGR
jgi:hypothetical protein